MDVTKKIVLLGQFGVGKTSLVRRFMTNEFVKDYTTTLGVQIKKKLIKMPDGSTLSMIIWDLEGFSSVSKTRPSYLVGSHGFIYVFDMMRPATYYNLESELSYLRQKYPKVVLKIIGNKSDEKTPENIKEYLLSKKVNVHSFVSAKTGEGVNELFNEIALDI
jgi:small GTP-binding protein